MKKRGRPPKIKPPEPIAAPSPPIDLLSELAAPPAAEVARPFEQPEPDFSPAEIAVDYETPRGANSEHANRRPTLGEMQADSNGAGAGLKCQHCECQNFKHSYTRDRADGTFRRWVCRNCGKPLLTMERPIFR